MPGSPLRQAVPPALRYHRPVLPRGTCRPSP